MARSSNDERPVDLSARLEAARARRAPLLEEANTDCHRWVNGVGDDLADVTIDRFGHVAVVSLYRDVDPHPWLDAITDAFRPRAMYLKHRPRSAQRAATELDALSPELPVRGEAVPELTVHERGLSFLIRPGQGLSVGLYLDAREARAWVERTVLGIRGARVLNLFAYTGGFGVAAHRAGAERVVQVDLSRRVLAWAKENVALNGVTSNARDYLFGDAFEWLARLERAGDRFEVVIADPPSFSSSRGGVFSAERDYPRLAEASARVVAEGGSFFALCNQASMTAATFEAKVRTGIAESGREIIEMERGGASAVDFPPAPGEPVGLKVMRLTLR